jgi:LPS sulfotransferase NodH
MSAPQLHTTYIICATPRSGSHLLAEALQVTGLAGKPDEYFITNKKGQLQNVQGNIAELYGKKSLEQFRELVLSLGSTPNGVFGIILQWDYVHHIFRNFRSLPQYANLNDKALLDALFDQPKFIWLQRQNKARQAISSIKAERTGIWKMQKDSANQRQTKPEMHYDYFLIDQNVKRFENAEQAWASFFQTNKIEPLVVVYEDLAQNFEQTSLALLDFLNISRPSTIQFKERKLKKQADTLNEEWTKKYLQQKNSLRHRLFRLLRNLRFKFLPS